MEHYRSDPEPAADAALHEAIAAAGRRRGTDPVPEFSASGGVTVSDRWGRTARVQPLGTRTRITLTDQHRLVAEGEVDTEALTAGVARRENPYDAMADALDDENGPGYRSG